MATPPPPQLTEYDDGPAGSSVRSARGTRRGRWKLAVAALPLLFAVALFLVNVLGDTDGGAEDGHAAGEGATDRGAVDTDRVDTGWVGSGWVDGGLAGAAGATAEVAAPAGIPVPAPSPLPVPVPASAAGAPVPPDGHRAVAIRFAAPDAVDLVADGDRIDVVGLDGDVLAAGLEVLQDRSTAQARVLVVAVPAEQAPELAAAAAARDLTLLPVRPAG
ncbi:hypothetical protein AB0K08_11125 [Citricoccus sp. NPDC055426]|uniref:hypothetical protein n=1 Tax=Citricoccus sp. NPDC055426 TaxID=3155536 RepID=UPI003446569B